MSHGSCGLSVSTACSAIDPLAQAFPIPALRKRTRRTGTLVFLMPARSKAWATPPGTRSFEALLAELGHELWMGDAAKIRASVVRKKKTDARDAAHLLELLRQDRFPQI